MIYHNTEDNVASKAYCGLHYDPEAGAGSQQSLLVYIPIPPRLWAQKDKELWMVNDRLTIKIEFRPYLQFIVQQDSVCVTSSMPGL
jgi:hypothetical protein